MLRTPLPLLLMTGLLLGCTFPLGALATSAGAPPAVWAFLTSAGGALTLALVMLARREALSFAPAQRRFYIIGALLSYVAPNFLVFLSIPHLGAGFTSIMYALSPIGTLVLASVLRVRATSRLGIVGIGVGLIGALLIVFGKGQIGRPAEWSWLLLALLIPISLAAGNVYRTVAWPPGASGVSLAVGCNLAAAWILLGLIAATSGLASLTTLTNRVDVTIAQALTTAMMLLVFFRLQIVGGPVYLSQIGYIAAAVGLFAGTVFLGETYGLATWAGAVVIVGGVSLTTLAQRNS